jgi:ribosomal protein S27AE
MPDTEKMKCPECGAEMNHHADKLDYGAGPDGETEAEGGVVVEAHTCPDCGCSATRPAR